MNHRIINLRYKCKGFNFDAAIDLHDVLHSHLSSNEKENTILIELYNLDKPDWDIKVIYLKKEDFVETYDDIKDKINQPDSSFSHSFVSFGFIYNETIKWINKMSAQRTIEIPAKILEDIIHYCEYNEIYDKLTNFGDFYYKLKQLL